MGRPLPRKITLQVKSANYPLTVALEAIRNISGPRSTDEVLKPEYLFCNLFTPARALLCEDSQTGIHGFQPPVFLECETEPNAMPSKLQVCLMTNIFYCLPVHTINNCM